MVWIYCDSKPVNTKCSVQLLLAVCCAQKWQLWVHFLNFKSYAGQLLNPYYFTDPTWKLLKCYWCLWAHIVTCTACCPSACDPHSFPFKAPPHTHTHTFISIKASKRSAKPFTPLSVLIHWMTLSAAVVKELQGRWGWHTESPHSVHSYCH